MSADDQYEAQNDPVSGDVPAGDSMDNDYTSRTGQKNAPVPVQKDTDAIDDPIDAATADSDEQLGKLSSASTPPHLYYIGVSANECCHCSEG